MTGNRSRLPFSALYSLRSNLLRTPAQSALTVIALAASVALAVAAEMSTRALEQEIDETADSLSGAAELEVSAGGPGVPEALLESVRAVPGVAHAAPLITGVTSLAEGEEAGRPLQVLGVDFTSDRKVRDYSLTNGTVQIDDALRLLSQIDSIIVTRELAKRQAIELGGTLRVRGPEAPIDLAVRGLLEPGGVADAWRGQIAAMDVYALQERLGRRGHFDRIDVVRAPGVELDALRERLQAAVAGSAQVARSRTHNETSDGVYGTVRLCLWFATGLAMLVSGLLGYGTLSLAVDRRGRELALLQVAGLEPRRVRRLVFVDALATSVAAVGLGLLAGTALSRSLFTAIVEFAVLNGHLTAAPVAPTLSTLGIAVAVGLVLGAVGSLEPALRATSRRPLEALRGSAPGRARRGAQMLVAGMLALLCLGLALGAGLSWRASSGPLAARLLLGLLACFLLSGPLFGAVARARPLLQRLVPSVGGLAGWSLLARPVHSAFAVIGVTAAVATGVATLVTIESLDFTFRSWWATAIPARWRWTPKSWRRARVPR